MDVTPATIDRMQRFGDPASARILERIYRDEIRHVGTGTQWFAKLCDSAELHPENHWKHLVNRHFRGVIKPPFNDSARESAGLTRSYYVELATPARDAQ